MDDLAETLALILNELPDPDQELFFQPLLATAFHSFPRLPTEVRLLIWRHAFPRARYIICKRLRRDAESYYTFVFPASPITSRINAESRGETLKHYQPLEKSSSYICVSDKHKVVRPVEVLLWNKTGDRLRVNTWGLINRHIGLVKFFKTYFLDEGKSFFKSLELLEWHLHHWCQDCYLMSEKTLRRSWVQYFISASDIRVIYDVSCAPATSEQRRNETLKTLREGFQTMVVRDPSRKLPNVVLHEAAELQ